MKLRIAPVLAIALALGACVSTPTAEVTRFHLGQPVPSDTIRVVASDAPAAPGTAVPLEFRTYAAAVERELAARGFRPVESGASAYIALLSVEQMTRAGIGQRSPFTIGIGGGIGGGGFRGGGGGFSSGGIGGGIALPVGRARNNDIRVNELALRIRRESDNTFIWEGRAVQEVAASAAGSNLAAAVPALSAALLQDFPGASGQTVTVKLR